MSKVLKPRRGSTAQNNAMIGEEFEITYDTDKNTIVCRDGATAGGFPLAKEAELEAVKTAQAAKDAAQDEAIAEAQSTADSALDAANNITVPVTSVNGKTGAVTVGTVRTVNGVAADSAGNVSVTHPVTSVNGMTGAVTISSVTTATNATTTPNVYITKYTTSFSFPSGGTWKYYLENHAGTVTCGQTAGGTSFSADGSAKYIIAIRTA